MDNQNQTIPTPETPIQPTNNGWLKTLSLGLGVIGIGILIGITGYFLAAKNSKPAQINPKPESIKELNINEVRKASPDSDQDGIKNIDDNCPFISNANQVDSNGDRIGNVCQVIQLAKEDLVKRLNGNSAVLGISEKAEDTSWANSCLGVDNPEELCTQVITPGYKVTFTVSRGGKKYLYHTDRTKSFRFVGEVK